jgi:gluconate 2-dehydrogenase gamma chain
MLVLDVLRAVGLVASFGVWRRWTRVDTESRSDTDEAVDVPDLLSRRHFLERSALVAGSAAVLGIASEVPGLVEAAASHAAEEAYTPVALTSAEMTTLKAVLSRLIPKDKLGPGAVEAHVHIYIDQQLAGYYKDLLPTYQKYLPMFETAASSMGAAPFAKLSHSQQDALLKQFEAGQPPGTTSPDTSLTGLFQLLLEHTREGMFADPMYGGNYKFAGWDLIGYPGIRLAWTAQQQAVGTKVKPAHKSAKAFGGKPYNGPTT